MVSNSLTVQPDSLVGQQVFRGKTFPLMLVCRTSAATVEEVTKWIESELDAVLAQADEYGAILFRDFPIASAADFDAFVGAFGLPNFPYNKSLSNAVRVNFTERVFSANEAPADVKIYLHHEMAQTPVFPSNLFFYCQQPAEEGGQTPICRSDVLFERLAERSPDFARKCEQKGLRYSNVMPSENDPESGMGRSWQSTLGAASRGEAEQRLRELGYAWEWLSDGSLRATTPVLPAVREITPGRKTFFNQLIAAFCGWKDARNDPAKAICFGDGEPLDADAVHEAAALADELTFDVPWRRGDVVLVDNTLVMHGRRTFRGTRKVLASLVAAQSHAFKPSGA